MTNLTPEQIANLKVIFTYARRAVVDDTQLLIGVINFEKELSDALTKVEPEKLDEKK